MELRVLHPVDTLLVEVVELEVEQQVLEVEAPELMVFLLEVELLIPEGEEEELMLPLLVLVVPESL
jgi:hypothetical protein